MASNTGTIGGFNYSNIASTSTTVVKTGAGILHVITLNKPTATTTLAIYDGIDTNGTLIGTVTVPTSPQPSFLMYDVSFKVGLTVVMGTANSDITVAYV